MLTCGDCLHRSTQPFNFDFFSILLYHCCFFISQFNILKLFENYNLECKCGIMQGAPITEIGDSLIKILQNSNLMY